MTELETTLANALEKLSTQYNADMTKIEKQISPQLLPKMTIKTDIAIRVVFNHVSIDFFLINL
jgi:hypothetical protein